MAVSLKNIAPGFETAGQKPGLEIWRIENFRTVPVASESYGKFFVGDSYVILKTNATKSGGLRHDIHFWLGKNTSQDEAGAASIKAVELDAALGGKAVQYREVQGSESDKFLSYFKPCIIPQDGGVASGFKHVEEEEYKPRLFVCKGKHVVHVDEVAVARSSLNHDDIFVLDTKSKIFQFNGSNSCIQERAKALEVVQYLKDTFHDGKCEIAAIEDGKLMADAQSGEFWGFFGGFAPLPRRGAVDDATITPSHAPKLFRLENEDAKLVEAESLTKDMLDTDKCYVLDLGSELFLWIGRRTSLDERRSACKAVEGVVGARSKCQITRTIEGCETLSFRSKFDSWPLTVSTSASDDGRNKVAALLKRQGVNVKGLLKAAPVKEEPQPFIDVTGILQVWRVNGDDKVLLSASDQSKFYTGDSYIFQYTYPGEFKEEILLGTWFGKSSVEAERVSATAMVNKMVESSKLSPTQFRFYEGSEPTQFYIIFQSFIVYKGGLSSGYKNHVTENELQDETYSQDGLALFRIQGSGPDNMQAIQVEPVAASLNSAYGFILHNDSSVYTWFGNLTTAEDTELVERFLDAIKPNVQDKKLKEGTESENFWTILGGKTEYSNQKIARLSESDPVLFCWVLTKGNLKVTQIHSFSQDDLMTEDTFILNTRSAIYVWLGQKVDSKIKTQALSFGQKFIEDDVCSDKLSVETPLFAVMEGSEPPFFTRFFPDWNSAKSSMVGNSFERRLSIVINGGPPVVDKTKRRAPVFSGRSAAPEKSQRSRSMSFSPERARARGRSPAFNALAANFENANARNLSTPPPLVRKINARSSSPDTAKLAPKTSAIAALFSSPDQPPPARNIIMPKSSKASQKVSSEPEAKTEGPAIAEGAKEGEAEVEDEPVMVYPYERVVVNSADPVDDIDITKRESYLSSVEFREKFGMSRPAFAKLPKWKQNKLKMALLLF